MVVVVVDIIVPARERGGATRSTVEEEWCRVMVLVREEEAEIWRSRGPVGMLGLGLPGCSPA